MWLSGHFGFKSFSETGIDPGGNKPPAWKFVKFDIPNQLTLTVSFNKLDKKWEGCPVW